MGTDTKVAYEDRRVRIPLSQGVVVFRDAQGTVWTNVPHLCAHHSPTGFEFGYAGSGPADLALNVLEAVLRDRHHEGPRMQCYNGTCYQFVWNMHQVFKRLYIATIDQTLGGVVPRDVIELYITTFREMYPEQFEEA